MIKTYLERLDSLIQQADAILTRVSQQNLLQAGVDNKKEHNIKQAAIKSDREVMDTMLEYMKGDTRGGFQPPAIGRLSDNPQSNIKLAGIKKRKTYTPDQIEDAFAEFA